MSPTKPGQRIEGKTVASARPREVILGVPYPFPSSDAARRRMRANRSVNTKPEMRLRSAMHRLGLRFRVNSRLRVDQRRPILVDVVFPRDKLAVFVDGCFWHGCRQHRSIPLANREYWETKIDRNRARDLETTSRLEHTGWRVVRVWEHEPEIEAALSIAEIVRTNVR
jgi:DNA mismatch endonuclease, patch repair protein